MEIFSVISVIGIIIAIILLSWRFAKYVAEPLTTQAETQKCPFCKSRIPRDAIVCKYCRRDLEPLKAMTTDDMIAQRELRLEAINKVMDKFSAKYPEVILEYDTTLGDIIIKVPTSHPDPRPQPEMIQKKMIEELRNLGIDAEARFFRADTTIKTRRFIEGVIENTLANVRKEQKQKFDSGLCPECNQKINPEFTECSSCGFDFNKLKFKQDTEIKPRGRPSDEVLEPSFLLFLEQKKMFDKGFCPSCNEKIDPNSTKCSCGFDFYENNLIQ